MRKDFVQHARPLAVFFVGALALPLAFSLLARTDKDGAGYVGTVFGFLAIGAPMLFGQWFVGQEKTKGTFRLLRSLPISGTGIIMTKFLGSTLLCLPLINLALLLEPLVCQVFGLRVPQPAAALVVWTNLAACFLVAISIALFTMLDARMATQVILWSMCILALCTSLAGKYLQGPRVEAIAGRAVSSLLDLRVVAISGIVLAGVATAAAWVAALLFERKEWSQLEEG